MIKLRESGATLDGKSRSRQFNLAGFHIDDEEGVLEVFKVDYENLMVAFEMRLDENFRNENDMQEIFYYACQHGMQNEDASVNEIFQRFCRTNCPYICLFQLHVATLIKSLPKQVIETDFEKLARTLRETIGGKQINCYLYNKWLIRGCHINIANFGIG